MGHDVERSIVIAAPPERVWQWTVEDVERERSWRNLNGTGVQTLERSDDGPLAVGARFRGEVKFGPSSPQAYVNAVTELEPPRRIAWETVDADGPLSGRGSYTLVPVDGGTWFDVALDYPSKTFVGRLQRPIVRLVGGRFITRGLAKLKRLVEQELAEQGE